MAGRFVILRHHHQGVHYDLMLEVVGKLRSWRLAEPPMPGRPVRASVSFNHRLLYLDYEGPVSGDRGHVERYDRGMYDGDADGAGPLRVWCSGERLRGWLELRLVQGEEWEVRLVAG